MYDSLFDPVFFCNLQIINVGKATHVHPDCAPLFRMFLKNRVKLLPIFLPVCASGRDMDNWLRGLLHKWNKRQIGKIATDFWACSEDAAKWFYSGETLKKAVVIHNAIDVERMRFDEEKRKAIRTKYGWKDKYIIGNVGRLHFQKNQSFALDIFAEYLKKNKNALLVLVGQGEDKRMLKEKADKLGIADGIEVRLGVDYLEKKNELDALAEKVIYTGPIDAYFGYKLGYLEYRSVRFENEVLDKPNFQGNAAVNYTDRETPWTRIIEHKWFEFGKDENGNDLPKTIISREYSSEWKPGDEPYYPVNDEKNGKLYAEYKKLADGEKKVIFGGRLGEYKYYDMDAVIASALEMSKRELKQKELI